MSTSNSINRERKAPNSFFTNILTKRQKSKSRQEPTRRWPITTLGLIILAFATLGAIAAWETQTDAPLPSSSKEPTLKRVVVSSVVLEDGFSVKRSFSGTVEARRTSPLSFRRTDELKEVSVEEGQWIEAGKTLATLDTRSINARIVQRKAELNASIALLDEFLAGPREEDIDAARARVAELEAKVNRVSVRKNRLTKAFKSGAASDDELDEVKFDVDATAAALAGAKHQLRELVTGTRKEQIQAQKSVVAGHKAAIASLTVDLEDSVIKAPFEGRVGRILIDEGTVVQPGEPVLRLVESGSLEAWVGLPVDTAQRMPETSTHTLMVRGESHTGVLKTVMPQLDARTRTVQVVFTLEDTCNLVPGQIVRLQVEHQIEAQGFRVPASALVKSERGLWSLYIIQNSKGDSHQVKRADVELIHTDGNEAFVRGALSTSTQFILSGIHRVVPGQQVSVQPKH